METTFVVLFLNNGVNKVLSSEKPNKIEISLLGPFNNRTYEL